MLFIKQKADNFGWYDYLAYWKYLDSIADRLPPNIAAFARDETNYNLDHPNSLHDSWLESWNVQEFSKPEKRSNREIQIDVCLLGSRHDRFIYLTYRNVTRHRIDANRQRGSRGHSDILVHEFRIEHDGLFVHEYVFDGDSRFLVEFEAFEYRLELLDAP